MTSPFDSESDRRIDRDAESGPPIDWANLRAHDDALDEQSGDVRIDHPSDGATSRTEALAELQRSIDALEASRTKPHDLLNGLEPLDPLRRRVPMIDLHPDRFQRATDEQTDALKEAWDGRDTKPYEWVQHINPGAVLDQEEGRAGRTENCAECARSVQMTIEGRPTVAAAIDERGLTLVQYPADGGEDLQYSEHWAGRRAEATSWGDVEQRVRSSKGSAIVFLSSADSGDDGPPQMGHATNAVWDATRREVMWVDGQVGRVTTWPPPDDVRDALPLARLAIFFDGPTERGTR